MIKNKNTKIINSQTLLIFGEQLLEHFSVASNFRFIKIKQINNRISLHGDSALSEDIEEPVLQQNKGVLSSQGRVLKKLSDQINCLLGLLAQHCLKSLALHRRKRRSLPNLHFLYVFFRGSSQYSHYLEELLFGVLPPEKRLPQIKLCHDAADGPKVDLRPVYFFVQDQFRRSVVSRANVGYAFLVALNYFG